MTATEYTEQNIKSPFQGIIVSMHKQYADDHNFSKKEKLHYWKCLNALIETETDKTILSWAYNLRGNIYSGVHSFIEGTDLEEN